MNNLNLTPIVKNLLIANVVVYVLLKFIYPATMHPPEQFNTLGELLMVYENNIDIKFFNLFKYDLLGLNADLPNLFLPIQLVTHFFNHGSIMHLLFNMMALAFIGPLVEMVMGGKRFLRFYLFCGVMAGILVTLFDPSWARVVGASGALLGVLAAFAFYFPEQRLGILFLPFSFKSRNFALGIAAISAVFVVLSYIDPLSNYGGNISHFGHLAGMLSAVLYGYLERILPFGD